MREKNIEIKFKIPYLEAEKETEQLIISSHERSGTHFLMNSIDFAFKHYSSKKFINLDYQKLGSFLNFHSASSLENFFNNLYNNKNISIYKNHFNAFIFENINEKILNKMKFIFIYRDLIETLKSYWIFINNTKWFEGPKIETFSKFCFTRPTGQLLRYDNGMANNFIERYYYTLKSWEKFSKNKDILFINFKDLKNDYEFSLDKISKFLNLPIQEKNKYERSNYFEVKFNDTSNLNYDEINNQKILDYYINLIKTKNEENKIFEEIIKS